MAVSSAGTMKLVGGDPCIDFVNTVGGRLLSAPPALGSVVREDKLGSYDDLLAWARHADVLTVRGAGGRAGAPRRRPREASRVLARAVSTREALHRVLVSLMRGRVPPPRDLAALNAELTVVRGQERLVPGPNGLHWQPALSGVRLEAVLWPVWRAAAALLTSGDAARLRECGGEGCGWLFLDRSRNHSRRWCTMEDCGNVSKVRRFRRKQRPD
jgi:predicted RNA-binding Zn ribbon-like protein